LYDAAAALLSIAAGALVLGPLGGGLTAAAATLAIPVAISTGVLTPVYACRALGLPVRRYLREVWPRPLLLVLPAALILVAARLLAGPPVGQLTLGVGLAGILTAGLYWRWALPAEWRRRLRPSRPFVPRRPKAARPEAAHLAPQE
jgi:hypothetical protein